MGIRLDWEIEAEGEQVQTAGEDMETRRRRWRARLRLLGLLLLTFLIIGGVVGAIVLRLREVEWQIEQTLRDTVDAEVATLRLGDLQSFLGFQRSATEDWNQRQLAQFEQYQALKLETDVRLTGRIISSAVDGQRGRVQVEEIIGSIPYTRVWFYWRYDDGWRHVPPDYTFWGDPQTLQADHITVQYRALDEPVAQAVAGSFSEWLRSGCAALTCDSLPSVTVEVVPSPLASLNWSSADPWLLQVPSPLIDRARLDTPVDLALRVDLAALMAHRLVTHVSSDTPSATADANFLRSAVTNWLIEQFAQVRMDSHLINSLVGHHGATAVGRLLDVMPPDASIAVLSQVTGAPLSVSELDWRDFVGWRLRLEDEVIAARDEVTLTSLYDTNDSAVRERAYARFNANQPGQRRTIASTRTTQDERGAPLLQAGVMVGDEGAQEIVEFRLIDGVWKRAS